MATGGLTGFASVSMSPETGVPVSVSVEADGFDASPVSVEADGFDATPVSFPSGIYFAQFLNKTILISVTTNALPTFIFSPPLSINFLFLPLKTCSAASMGGSI